MYNMYDNICVRSLGMQTCLITHKSEILVRIMCTSRLNRLIILFLFHDTTSSRKTNPKQKMFVHRIWCILQNLLNKNRHISVFPHIDRELYISVSPLTWPSWEREMKLTAYDILHSDIFVFQLVLNRDNQIKMLSWQDTVKTI